jgi:hypothetical protein
MIIIDQQIQKRIDELYAGMKSLMDEYGIKPKTIEERYQEYLRKQTEKERLAQIIKSRPQPRFKLPKL